MPNRNWSFRRYHALMEWAKGRDGDICLLCLKTVFKLRERTLDHLDNGKENHDPANIHLLCRGCNTAENNRLRAGNPRLLTAKTLSERLAIARAHLAKTKKNSSQMPLSLSPSSPQVPTMQSKPSSSKLIPSLPAIRRKIAGMSKYDSSLYMVPIYWLWLFRRVKEKGSITKRVALNDGALYLRQSIGRGHPKTLEPYFEMQTGEEGFLIEDIDEQGQSVWRLREDYDPDKENQLERDVQTLTGR